MDQPVPNTSQRRSLLLASMASVLFVLIVVVWVGFLVRFILDVRRSAREFPLRHVEAREAIEFVYRYEAKHGRWPTDAEVQAQHFVALAKGWQYKAGWGIDGAPTVGLHGPYHMMLYYHFEPPLQGKIVDEWSLSIEGDKKYFRAEQPYSLR